MIGVFDSGIGGLAAFKEIRTLLPRENIIYLADRKNAPYGTKNEDEITKLCTKNISKLRDMGAEKILIACCTASGVYQNLSADDKQISIPIITPTAQEVVNFSKRIAVIATERTVSSHYFSREIAKYSSAEVKEFAMQRLVYLVENGCLIQLSCNGVTLVAGQGDPVCISEGLRPDVLDHPVKGLTAVPVPLLRAVDHHMPDIILGNVAVIDHQHIADHLPAREDPKGLALLPVDIGLRKAPYGVGDKHLLPRREGESERVKEIILCYCF